MYRLAILLLLAAIPFLAKGGVLALGLSGYILQSLYKVFQLIIPCGWRYWEGKRGVQILWPTNQPLPSTRTWLLAVGVAVALSLIGIGAILALGPMFALDPVTLRAGFNERFTVGPVGAALVVVFLSSANSGLEELHFRAWLDRELTRLTSPAVGIVVSAAAFGGMHILIFAGLQNISVVILGCAVAGLAIAGACWSLLLRLPGGIHAAWLSHGLTDAFLLTWGLWWLGYF